jgi:glycerol-3-phosphate acyltransferase PlsY
MNINKLVAALIAIAIYVGPFYYLFIRNNGDETVDTGKEMLIGVSWILGMILAFYFAVNEPIQGKSAPAKGQKSLAENHRKAA